MAVAISQKTALIDRVFTCEGESIYDKLQDITNNTPQGSISLAIKKQPPLLASLEKQVEDNRIRVLRNTSLMFGTY
ncbi:MAG: hypothetical protein KAS47_02475 [Candidatus Heimdallarchaeota archaeon]|nr:hypothetical protein [Candidatus Heimdallarchaeota archaeon]